MAGSWELLEQKRVLAYTLHVDVCTVAWALGIRNLQGVSKWLPLAGMPFDMARNTACMACLEGGYSHILSVDSDVIAPPHAVLQLLSHNLPVVSAVYCRRSPPHGVPVAIKNGTWVKNLPARGLLDVDVVGAGFLLIHRSVLEQMKPQRPGAHWFDWRVHLRGSMPDNKCLSEDFTFNIAIKEQMGIKTFIDCGLRCKHVGYAEADYGSLVPLNTHPIDIL